MRILSNKTYTAQLSEKHHSFLVNLGANSGLNVDQTLEKLLDINIAARSPQKKATSEGFALTEQQQQGVDLALQGYSVKIEACAGSGKTTILKRISYGMPEKKGLVSYF